LLITSGIQKFIEGPFRVRVPALVTGTATVRESFDEGAGRFRIDVQVIHHRFGPLFGYHGSFTTEYVDTRQRGVPATVKPLREEIRC
jgi:hypothetical protein